MHIAVCLKQVPDTTDVRINPETNTLVRDGVASIINPFDVYAIEEAVRVKERPPCGGSGKVTVITMGPPQAEAALREALSVGADEAVLLTDRAFGGGDTLATSWALACAIRRLAPDLVLCGKQAIDGDTAQVGPGIACHLDWPQACYVSKIVEMASGRAVVECLMDNGRETLEVALPAVMTVVKEINEPRLASLKGKMRAKKAEIVKWGAAEAGADPARVGLKGSPTAVFRVFSPPKRGGGERIEGDGPAEKARILVAKLKSAQII